MQFKKILTYILICWMMSGVIGVFTPQLAFGANNQSSLSQKLKQTNSKRNYIQTKKREADLKLKKEKNKLSTNQQKLERAHIQLQENTIRYNNLVANLSTMEVQLNKAMADFQKVDAEMKSRVRDVYKHQRFGMFELILSARSVNALLDTLYFEKLVIQEDYKKMQAVKAEANRIANLKSQVESQKRMIETSIRDINNQRTNIQRSLAENKLMIERLQKDKSYYEKTEKELAAQSSNIQNMIASLAKKAAKQPNNQVKVASGSFIRPISGPITSPFGYRTHPIFQKRIFHSGIDIGGPNRGAIKASNNGRVIYSGWYGGYGKVVILDHGIVNNKPVTTLYGHMSDIKVSNGQNVTKGQTIGLEGSTGYSTGPHCHFEVRENGKPVNPLNYI